MLPECGFELIHKSHDCDVGPLGHGCVLDAGTTVISCHSFDIYRALDMDTQASVLEEADV